jgi:hypothetical protein
MTAVLGVQLVCSMASANLIAGIAQRCRRVSTRVDRGLRVVALFAS